MADRHIAVTEDRLLRQREAITRLQAEGEDTTAAEALLRDMERHLELLHEHRCTLLHGPSGEPCGDPHRRALLDDESALARLRRAGFTREQVEALADWLDPPEENVARIGNRP